MEGNQNLSDPTTRPPQTPNLNSTVPQEEHTPLWLVILLFLIFQPAALFIILKENYYYRFLPFLIWFYAIPVFITYFILKFYVIPQMNVLYKTLDIPNSTSLVDILTIFFMTLLLIEIFFGFILLKSFKKLGYISKKLLIFTILFFIANFIFSPVIIILGIIKPIYTLTSSSVLEPTIPKTIEQISPTPTIDPTANWKTYTNIEGKYTFKYPGNYELYENVYPPVIISDKSIQINQSTNPAKNTTFLRLNPVPETGRIFSMSIHYDVVDMNKSLENVIKESCEYYSKAKSESFTLGSKKAVIFIDNKCAQSAGTVIYATNGNRSYSIGMAYTSGIDSYKEFQKYAEQILQTFKFLDVNHPSQSIEDEGKDTKRKSDLRMIQGGLELFKYDKGKYPNTLAEMTPLYMKMIPVDPNPNNYYFYQAGNDGFSYSLSATLSDGSKYRVNNP